MKVRTEVNNPIRAHQPVHYDHTNPPKLNRDHELPRTWVISVNYTRQTLKMHRELSPASQSLLNQKRAAGHVYNFLAGLNQILNHYSCQNYCISANKTWKWNFLDMGSRKLFSWSLSQKNIWHVCFNTLNLQGQSKYLVKISTNCWQTL